MLPAVIKIRALILKTLFRNIKKIVQVETGNDRKRVVRGKEMSILPTLDQSWLLVENGRIADFGGMEKCPDEADEVVDASGRMLFPCWCDSHTHLVYAGSRESEFVDRIRGLSYEEIARRGGGILNSAQRLQETSAEALFRQAWQRLKEIQQLGTGAVEIKSGYGLTVDSELKMLRVIRRLKENASIPVKATFLGAHALPGTYREDREGYIRLIIREMLPRIAEEGLADYIDVFCEKGFFNAEETLEILRAGRQYGLRPKIHTNQFNIIGGVEVAVQQNALSVDHLEVVHERDIAELQKSETIATLLPSAPFFINDRYPPARRLIEAGLPVALASDYNPGSTPSGRMAFVLALACIKLRMTPEEAVNAATINGAAAMELNDDYGSIARGKVANLFLTKPIPSIAFIPYAFGSDLIENVYLNGIKQ